MRIGHDNKGSAPGWFLSHVIVRCDDEQYFFGCNKWYVVCKVARLAFVLLYYDTYVVAVCVAAAVVHLFVVQVRYNRR